MPLWVEEMNRCLQLYEIGDTAAIVLRACDSLAFAAGRKVRDVGLDLARQFSKPTRRFGRATSARELRVTQQQMDN
ncbi:hypothetical protein CBM2634_P20001 [Cupriavidus taiwanensis]|uniref:Uncharacterized protein n=1 Tax=Cupriavidus taiwanensis TaxID=164546 RepID=A0A375JF49_9BURK|nr:hypothetical protein CBM2634_P20001 [Cupriavidus taiwanensis]